MWACGPILGLYGTAALQWDGQLWWIQMCIRDRPRNVPNSLIPMGVRVAKGGRKPKPNIRNSVMMMCTYIIGCLVYTSRCV